MLERVNAVLNVVVIVVAAVVLFRPGGPVVSEVRQHWAEREARERIHQLWSTMADTEARRGAEQAPVQLVEFFDYQCPYCRQAHRVLEALASRHASVAVAYRHLPLSRIHPRAEGAAKAAICAEEQGQFEALHSHLMENETWQRSADWKETARAAGLEDVDRFSRCMTGRKVEARLAEDRRLAERLGVRSTPTFVYRDGMYRGVPTVTEMEDLLGLSP